MSQSVCRHLFVYGTLMTGADAAPIGGRERRALQAVSRSLGPATMAGRLYDLGRYPVLIEPMAATDVVHGEVFELADPQAVFAVLDPYEGVDPARPVASEAEYRREVHPVWLADGTGLDAWVYVHQRAVTNRRHITDGRWRP